MNSGLFILFIILAVIFVLLIILLTIIMRMGEKDLPKGRRIDIGITGGVDINLGRIGNDTSGTLGFNDIDTISVNVWNNRAIKLKLRSMNDGTVYFVYVNGTATLGRLPGERGPAVYGVSEVSSVSRAHCVIYEARGLLYIRDNNSKNHTYLNGRLVSGSVRLRSGDVIGLGRDALFTTEIEQR